MAYLWVALTGVLSLPAAILASSLWPLVLPLAGWPLVLLVEGACATLRKPFDLDRK